jgi:hypothetical protein
MLECEQSHTMTPRIAAHAPVSGCRLLNVGTTCIPRSSRLISASVGWLSVARASIRTRGTRARKPYRATCSKLIILENDSETRVALGRVAPKREE